MISAFMMGAGANTRDGRRQTRHLGHHREPAPLPSRSWVLGDSELATIAVVTRLRPSRESFVTEPTS
jgi:hypothetical protein